MSPELKDEIVSIANRDKFRKYFSISIIKELEDWIVAHTLMHTILSSVPSRCRDSKDDYLLELAIQTKAIYLVSGDEDLLSLGNIENCRIMTFTQFEKEIESL